MPGTISDKIQVLLVDDDAAFLDTAAQMLAVQDDLISVTTATSVAEAMTTVSSGGIDCIVADYAMDESDGLEFLQKVRKRDVDLPFILYTGKGSEDIAAEAISAGVTDYFRKSGDSEQFSLLAHRIRNAVQSYRAQQADQTLQRELKRSYERITEGFFSVDNEWRYTYVNETGANLVDREPVDMIGRRIWDVFPEVRETEFEETIRAAKEMGESTTVEAFHPPRDTWYEVSIYPDEEGVSIYFRSIDDRKRHEQVLTALHAVAKDLTELESTEEICQRTIDAAENILDFDLSVIAIEEDGLLQPKAVSSEMEPGDYEPMSIREGIAGKTYRMGEAFLIDDAKSDEDARQKGTWRSGISIPVGDHGNFQAVDESEGTFDERDLQLAELLISHTKNQLDRLESRQRLERKNERLNEFAGIASHDLRNPLNVATGRLELATAECDSEHLVHVEESLQRMERLIEDLLSLAQQGKSISETEPVSLQSIVEECWTTVDTGNVRLENQAEGVIEADSDRLRQLFENLFRNASEHAGEDVTVIVGDHRTGFFVEDDGQGIDPAGHDEVFESGFTTKEDGTGFGLSIVREIVEAHDWNIRVTDGRDGGARFEITGVESAK